MILRAIATEKDLQTPTNLFLGSLAVADLLNLVITEIQMVC